MPGVLELDDLRAAVADATMVVPEGSRTQWEVGGRPPEDRLPRGDAVTFVRAPAGIVTYDPADLTVTAGAGTTCAELAEVLGAHGQECALDPRDPQATIGGVLAAGLSGHRRLRLGPLRDRVLEVRFVTGDGRLIKGGGPTVKNVSGFDLPRLLVGSLGTIGVLVQVTLRCQPVPATARWFVTHADPRAVRRTLHRPSCLVWDGTTTHVLLEGVAGDVADEAARITDAHEEARETVAPRWPDGAHRGRLSVRPSAVPTVGPALDAIGARWLAEIGVGTVHVATDDETALAAARAAAVDAGGWLLREQGAPGLDGFGAGIPNARLTARIRAAFDPLGKCAPGRLPLDSHDG